MNGMKFFTRAGTFPSNIIGLRSYVLARDSSAQATLETHLIAGRARTGGIPTLSSTSSIKSCQSLVFPGGDNESCNELWSSNNSVHIVGRDDLAVVSDPVCLVALNYPSYVLREDVREDSVTLALQIFSLGLGMLAMAQSHISHFVTGTLIQVISVAWASIRVRDTGISAADFDKVITNGACGGQLLGNFWAERWGLDVAVLSIDILCSLLSLVFSYKAAQSLLAPTIVYKAMIAALVSIELAAFFSLAAGAVWIEQIFFLDDIAGLGMGTKIMYGVAEVFMIPVLFLGWVSLHREMWKSVLTFLACSFVYLAGWGMTFLFEAFRWSVATWNLFGFLAIFAMILAFVTFVCTLLSACFFGKGMKKISEIEGNSPNGPNVHTIQSFQFRTSDDSTLEKGGYTFKKQGSFDSMDEKVAAPVATLPYQNTTPNGFPSIKPLHWPEVSLMSLENLVQKYRWKHSVVITYR
ncbi:hypothetical protein DL96DRAFT_1550325 [Flagelloscypha sp. PMI_526]|nr:hypothetical protein DL96DRAFT_1550325 [Flagelloscypha sp. PMI_526]